MHGTGNDFVVIDNRSLKFSREELSAFAAEWCPRRYGIGADGLLALDEARLPEADYRMRYVNADGSWASMCGNGARCLARFAQQNGFDQRELAFDTDAGLYRAHLGEQGPVRLLVPDVKRVRLEVDIDEARPDGLGALHFAQAGTEHLIAFVDDPASVPVGKWGERLRHDSAFAPEGTNVSFVGVEDAGELRLRTYEKGVEAETLSCGTGVIAAGVIAERTGVVNGNPITVHAKGGTLRVGTVSTERGSERFLEGPVVTVYKGILQRSNVSGLS